MRFASILPGVLAVSVTAPLLVAEDKADTEKRMREAATVLKELTQAEDKGIPHDLLSKAQCVGVVPNLKRAGFIVGGEYGKGVVTCRTADAGGWSALSTVRIEGGSIGAQIGAGETDVVFIVMNQRGMDKLMSDKFTVGADAAAMAGPVGRAASAETDAALHAEILSYSRSRGVFAGVTLKGATLRPDKDNNRAMYGAESSHREILTGKAAVPPSASPLIEELRAFPPKG
jgi:lipid-binding SYLF domain-containing protein